MSKLSTIRIAAAVALLCGLTVQSASALTPASGQTVPTFVPPASPYAGEVTVTGATLFGDFFRFPAQTNDYLDANGDGCSGPTACVQNLATIFAPGASISTFWTVNYRSVGSVNGLMEFVDWEISPPANTVFPVTAPSGASFFNGFSYIDANGNINWPNVGCPASTGQPFCPDFVDVAVSDVAIDYSVIAGSPVDARWNRKPEQSGYGQNLLPSNTGYPSLLQSLSRTGAIVSLNTNVASPDSQTIYNTNVAYVPIGILTNRGTGLQDVRVTQLQHLFVTGRMPSGENLVTATRSVGSGTRNACMNSLNIDPSFGRGDNVGNEYLTTLNSHLGPDFLPTNGQGSSRTEEVAEYSRLAIGYTGLGGASRAANDRVAGRYELLNICKDIDGDGDGFPDSDCTPSAGGTPHGGGNDVSSPNNGFVRPTINTVLDNSNPRTGWQIGGVEVFITRGDPLGMSFDFNGDTVFDLGPEAGHAGNPGMARLAPAAYIRNITESIKAFVNAPANANNVGMPGEYLATSFFLVSGVDALSQAKPAFATENPTKYLDQVGSASFSQATENYVRANNDLATGNAVGPFGTVNTAGLAPFRKKNTDAGGISYTYPDASTGKFSDGSTDGKYFYCDAASIIRSIGNPTALSQINAIAGDFNSDGFRDVNDIVKMVQAYYAPRTFDCGVAHAGSLGGMTANALIPEVIGDFNGDGQFDKEDLRYFMDGLGLYPNHSGTLNRKQAAIAIDNAILASAPTTDYLGNPVTTHDMLPWGDTGRDIVPGAPVVGAAMNPITHNPKFKKPSPGVDDVVNPFLKTHKVYQPGDFRGDVAGSLVLNSPTPGAAPTGYDGKVDEKDIDYVCKNFGSWSDLNQAVKIDLSCDLTGDLVVDTSDLDELVLVILGTHYGDRNLDGVVDAADEPQGPFPHPGGWSAGSFDCDGMVTQADHDIWQANLQSCTRSIASRGLFYNNSCFDGSGNGCNATQCATLVGVATCSDDTAIDPAKSPQLPGSGAATFANYSAFSKGINGISIDVSHDPSCAALAADASKFTFTVGNVLNPVTVAPPPTSVEVTALNATTDRIKIYWPDFGTAGALPNHQWLKVVVKSGAGGVDGLAADDTFYWGLAVGEDNSPNAASPKRAVVDGTDELHCRTNASGITRIGPTAPKTVWDFDKSSLVDGTDQLKARTNANTLSALLLFSR